MKKVAYLVPLILLLGIAFLGCGGGGDSTTAEAPTATTAGESSITFDDISLKGFGFASADRYRGEGIVFDRAIPISNVSLTEPGSYSLFLTLSGSAPNALSLALPRDGMYDGAGLAIDVSFVLPGTATQATTDLFQAWFFDTEVGQTAGTLQAFDASNVLLASSTLITPSSKNGVLKVSAPGIARVRISVDSDGADIDNMRFNTPSPPSSPR